MEIKLGKVAKEIREALGLTQKDAAKALEITNVHLSNIENDKAIPSASLLDRYRSICGIDLYVYAWCRHGASNKLPTELRDVAGKLSAIWEKQVKNLDRLNE